MMFYTQLFTSKKGPLAKVWLAAHWERKLTKAHVFECNLENTVKDIICPKVKIGLRTSGHLLVGVVRMYSRKAQYLLADCSDAFLKIKTAFRPGQTNLPVEKLEARVDAITLIEDFTDFDAQLPDPSNIDMVDHYSLNQCRPEEITLKEDFGNNFMFSDFDSQSIQTGLSDLNIQNIDAFGDECKEYDMLDFLTQMNEREPESLAPEPPQNEDEDSLASSNHQDIHSENLVNAEPSTVNVTLLPDEEEAFVLGPVPITPTLEKRRGTRKRKLIVDQAKQLTNEDIKKQLDDYSDLMSPLDLARPPRGHMGEWGGADKLFSNACSRVINPEIIQLFVKLVFGRKGFRVPEQNTEATREDAGDAHGEMSSLDTESINVGDSTVEPETTHNMELTTLMIQHDPSPEQENDRSDLTHPELPSQDSLFVQQSQQDTLSTLVHTQSMLNTQELGEWRVVRRAQKLLGVLQEIQMSQSSSEPFFSLKALCEGYSRPQVATTFLCFLILKKQQALLLQQSAPYEDILARPGPGFYGCSQSSV